MEQCGVKYEGVRIESAEGGDAVLVCELPKKHPGNHKGKVDCVVNDIADVREFEWARVVAKRPVASMPSEEEIAARIDEAVAKATAEIKAQFIKEPEIAVEPPASEPEVVATASAEPPEENISFVGEPLADDFGAAQRALSGEENSDE